MGKQTKIEVIDTSKIPDKYLTASVQHYGEDGWRAYFTYRGDDGKWKKKSAILAYTGWDKDDAKRTPNRNAARDEANEKLKKLNKEHRKHVIDKLTKPEPEPEQLMTVAECVSRYIKQNRQIQRSTRSSYNGMLKSVIAPTVGKIQLADLTKADVQAWVDDICQGKHKLSRARCSNSLRLLRAALTWATDDDQQYIERNVSLNVKLPIEEQKADDKPNALTEGELARVLATVNINLRNDNGYAKNPYMLAIKIAIYSGLRRGEICGLQWSDIDFENCTIEVNRSIGHTDSEFFEKAPKSASSNRTVEVSPVLIQDLKRRKLAMTEECMKNGEPLKAEHFVIGYADGSFMKPPRIDEHWRKLSTALRLSGTRNRKYVSFHCLRHTYTTYLLANNGYDLATTADQLGHSDPAITLKRYAATSNKRKRESVNNLDAYYDAVMEDHANDGQILERQRASMVVGA